MPKAKHEPVDPRDVAAIMAQFGHLTDRPWAYHHPEAFEAMQAQARSYAEDEGARGRFFDALLPLFTRQTVLFAWASQRQRPRRSDEDDRTAPKKAPDGAVRAARKGLIGTELLHNLPIALVYLYARLGAASDTDARSKTPYAVEEFAIWLAALSWSATAEFGAYWPHVHVAVPTRGYFKF